MDELCLALHAHPDTTVGFVNVSLDQSVENLQAWVARYLADPQIVGIGELTPAPGAAAQIEPVLQASADHAGVPVLTHGFVFASRATIEAANLSPSIRQRVLHDNAAQLIVRALR